MASGSGLARAPVAWDVLMMQYLTGGAWGIVIRRLLEAGAKTLYVMVPLFLPILLMPDKLFTWASQAHANDKIVQLKHLYLNVPFFWGRFILFGAFWLIVMTLLRKWGKAEEETRSMEYSNKLEKLSAPGLVFFFYTMTFFAIDMLMSLDVTWSSTIYGFLIIVGQALTALSVVVATLAYLVHHQPMEHAITKKHLHDLGKLMLALTMLWAYLGFSQLLIIWSGNLPQEITWYTRRLNGGWLWVGTILLLGHFVLPFLLLLSQALKKNPKTIQQIAIYIICIHAVDVFWLVEPNFVDPLHSTFAALAGHRGSARLRRVVAGIVLHVPAGAHTASDRRSEFREGTESWQITLNTIRITANIPESTATSTSR